MPRNLEMEALLLMPPKVVDLVWTLGSDDCYVARVTKPWLVLWSGDTQIAQLMEMGFSCGTVEDRDGIPYSQVRWNPHVAIKYTAYVEDLDLIETIHAEGIAYAKSYQRDMDRARLERTRFVSDNNDNVIISTDEMVHDVRVFIDDFKELLEDRDLAFLQDVVRRRGTYPAEMRRFERIRDKKDATILDFFVKRVGKDAGWDEEVVIKAAKCLTALDFDKAKLANGKGWAGSDTNWGHWATRSFRGPQHEMAVSVARFIVGRYADKQLKGIVP